MNYFFYFTCISFFNFYCAKAKHSLYLQKYLQRKKAVFKTNSLYGHICVYLSDFVICRQQNCRAVCLAVKYRIDNRAKKQFICVATISKVASFVIAVVQTDDLLRQILWCLLFPQIVFATTIRECIIIACIYLQNFSTVTFTFFCSFLAKRIDTYAQIWYHHIRKFAITIRNPLYSLH